MQVSGTGLYSCLNQHEVNIGSSLYTGALFRFLMVPCSQRIRKITRKENKEKITKIAELLFSIWDKKFKKKARGIDGVKQMLNLTTLWSYLSLFLLSQKYCLWNLPSLFELQNCTAYQDRGWKMLLFLAWPSGPRKPNTAFTEPLTKLAYGV